ncbi:YbaN family protein [Novosphingobium sp. B 225]|uniref:YbaN family protein n=1 Tax=Novosphingobium sp. B 225 TaxID=1961849 RepID=UPI003F91EE8F
MLPARLAWQGAGLTCVALGAIGAVLPIMPTVPFLLLAALCFARGRPEWAEKLYAHPKWGPSLREWRDRRAIPRRAKISALLAMSAGAVFTQLTLGWPWVLISLAVLGGAGSWIWTRNE